jgi:poly(3-hydroxybutyrate) depolymerase
MNYRFNGVRSPVSIAIMLTLLTSLIYVSLLPGEANAASFTRYSWGGGWYFKVYVPTGYDGSTAVPLMVMLHGCTQDADDFTAGTE